MADVIGVLQDMLDNIVNSLPALLTAIAVIIIGSIIGIVLGRAVKKLVGKVGAQKALGESATGKALKSSGLELPGLIGGVVKFFIIVLSIVLAIQILNAGGTFGTYLSTIADYLPRLLGGVLIITVGIVFADVLSSFIGKILRPMFPAAKVEIADMLKNLLFIGLIAFILLLGFNTMLLSGSTIYSLMLGFVVIGAGIFLTDGLVKSITDDHPEFIEVAGYAKFVIYSVFLIIGAGAIFATFSTVTSIVANISWAFAIALAIMLIPIAYTLSKRMSKETK